MAPGMSFPSINNPLGVSQFTERWLYLICSRSLEYGTLPSSSRDYAHNPYPGRRKQKARVKIKRRHLEEKKLLRK